MLVKTQQSQGSYFLRIPPGLCGIWRQITKWPVNDILCGITWVSQFYNVLKSDYNVLKEVGA